MQLTKDCNLKCKYCFQGDKSKWKNRQVSFEQFKELVDTVLYQRCYLGIIENPIDFHFHGGEITLIPEEELKKMILYLDKRREKFPGIQITMQTNGLNLTEDFCRFLAQHDVTIGTSFDGYHSDDRMPLGALEGFIDRLADLQSKTKVGIGILSVITSQNIKYWFDDLSKAMKKFPYGCSVGVNVIGTTVEDLNLVPSVDDQIEYWVKPVLNTYLSDEPLFHERDMVIEIDKTLGDLIFKFDYDNNYRKRTCFDRICARNINMTSVDPDMNIVGCDKNMEHGKFIDIVKHKNIKDRDFLGLENVQDALKYYKDMAELEKKLGCDECRAKNVCAGSCQSIEITTKGHVDINEDNCRLYKYVFDFIDEHWTDMLKHKRFNLPMGVCGVNPYALSRLEKAGLRLVINETEGTYYAEEK